MRKIINTLIFVAAAAALCACSKDKLVIDEDYFNVEIKRVGSESMWVDITPQYNEYAFMMGVMTAEEASHLGTGDAYLKAIEEHEHKAFDDLIDELHSIAPDVTFDLKFTEVMMYKGSYFECFTMLTPETDYEFFAVCCDKNNKPIGPAKRIPFRTGKAHISDIEFEMEITDGVAKFHPSNKDKYYWDYELISVVDDYYYGSPYLYYVATIRMLIEFDLLDEQLSSGDDSEDMRRFYDLKAGDEFYFVAAAYDSEIDSKMTTWKAVIYADESGILCGQCTKVEEPSFAPGRAGQSNKALLKAIGKRAAYSPKR